MSLPTLFWVYRIAVRQPSTLPVGPQWRDHKVPLLMVHLGLCVDGLSFRAHHAFLEIYIAM